MLPPGPLGGRQLATVLAEVAPLVARTADLRAAPGRTVEVLTDLADGRQVRGSVPGVHGTCQVSVGYSRLGPRDRLRSWIGLLALTASDPEIRWTAATVGRGEAGHPRCSTLGPVDPALAPEMLGQLVELYDAGLRAPLPLPTRTSAAYAAARVDDDDAGEAARKARRRWTTSGEIPGEDADAANERVWGRRTGLETLLAIPADPGDLTGPLDAAEPTMFGALALRLWAPLLDAERIIPL